MFTIDLNTITSLSFSLSLSLSLSLFLSLSFSLSLSVFSPFSHLSWPSPCAGPASIFVIQYFRYCVFSQLVLLHVYLLTLSLHLFFGLKTVSLINTTWSRQKNVIVLPNTWFYRLINFTTVNDVLKLWLCWRLTFYRVHAWRNYVVMNICNKINEQ